MAAPKELFSRESLREWAGDKAFAKGEEYFQDGRVRSFRVEGRSASARVLGQRPYKVRLWSQPGGSVEYSCECPTGRDGRFCKHSVAVGLIWLSGDLHPSKPDPLRRYLASLPRERLEELVVEATDYDSILRRRLTLEQAIKEARPVPETVQWKKLIREAIATKEYIDYDAIPDYSQGIEEVLQPLEAVIEGGPAGAALGVELCEYTLAEMDKVTELVDFGDPALSDLWQLLHTWHLRACRTAKPEPVSLATRLLKSEIESALGNFRDAATTYATVLGPEGVRAYAHALDLEWRALLPLGPGDRPASIEQRRVQITALMERIAVTADDWHAIVEIKSRDLSTAHDFLAIAEGYHRRGRTLEAITWAERGWEAFRARPGQGDSLRELLADLYHETGRSKEAMAIAWERFAAQPSLRTFRQLKSHASQAGEPEGAAVERALAHLRTRPAGSGSDGSLLVELLLAEDRADEAWEEAKVRECAPHWWLRLADQRETRDPAEALAIFRRATEACVEAGSGASYREAAEHLARVRRIMERLGRREAFEEYRAALRAKNQHRRLFVRLLDSLA